MENIIVKNLTKDYGFNRGVFDVSFHVSAGEVYGYLGPNGAGKSTTIRHLIGFSKPDQGQTLIFGQDTFAHYHELMQDVGYVPGEITLPAGLTGWDFIFMMKKLRKMDSDKRLKELLELLELNPSGEIKRMSLGNKRKLAIVAAFMHDPQILILDEPTSGLDPVIQERFIQLIKAEKEAGKTILLSSHIFSEVEAVCDRVSIIKNGRIVDEFPMSKLKHAEDKVYRLVLQDEARAKLCKDFLSHKPYAIHVSQDQAHLFVHLNDKEINQFIQDISNFPLKDFIHEKLTLEAYFMQYYLDDIQYKGV